MYFNPREDFTCLEKDALYWPVFATEFLAGFILVFAWLVVRKYDARDQFTWINIIKPIFVVCIYGGAVAITARVSNGPANPTLALQSWAWTAGSYSNDIKVQVDNKEVTMTQFEHYRLGRYVWLYIIAPMAASILAGFVARKHVDKLEEARENGGDKVFSEN